ncbi:MAG: hypothetical protein Kow0076_5310 [Francisella sp.]
MKKALIYIFITLVCNSCTLIYWDKKYDNTPLVKRQYKALLTNETFGNKKLMKSLKSR